MKTQAIMEAIADTIAAFRGFIGMVCRVESGMFYFAVPGPLTLQVTQKNTRKPQKSTQNVVY